MPATTPTSAAIRLPAAIPWWPSPVRARHHHGRPAGRTYQPQGGWLGFGPHGQLYIPLDDSGGGGDPDGNAQNPQSPLGKILRLDVGADAFPAMRRTATRYLRITPSSAQREWRRKSGCLGCAILPGQLARDLGTFFIGDVGQNLFEEVDISEAGANYVWDDFEGPQGFQPGPLGPGSLTDPIRSYGRSVGATVIGVLSIGARATDFRVTISSPTSSRARFSPCAARALRGLPQTAPRRSRRTRGRSTIRRRSARTRSAIFTWSTSAAMSSG